MNEPTSPRFDDLDPDLARLIDTVCRRFEADWRAGNRPPIGDYLADLSDQGRSVLRAELAALERELRASEATGGTIRGRATAVHDRRGTDRRAGEPAHNPHRGPGDVLSPRGGHSAAPR